MINIAKGWMALTKGWRTMVANAVILVSVLPDAIAQFAGLFLPAAKEFGLMAQLPKGWMFGYIIFVVVLNMFLRTKTDTPFGKRA